MLRLDKLEAGYGHTSVLKGVALEVREREIVALLGANGAGKSTTLLAISGLVRIRSGSVSVGGQVTNGWAPDRIVGIGVAHVPEGRRILPRLTVQENLELGAYQRTGQAEVRADLDRALALFPVLAERRRQLGGTLSGGEQQMLAMARGLMSRPKLLLLDEPSLGLAPKLVDAIFGIIRRINGEGVSVLLVEQNAYRALQIAHRGYVLETGKIALTDEAGKLTQNPLVKAAYLGG